MWVDPSDGQFILVGKRCSQLLSLLCPLLKKASLGPTILDNFQGRWLRRGWHCPSGRSWKKRIIWTLLCHVSGPDMGPKEHWMTSGKSGMEVAHPSLLFLTNQRLSMPSSMISFSVDMGSCGWVVVLLGPPPSSGAAPTWS